MPFKKRHGNVRTLGAVSTGNDTAVLQAHEYDGYTAYFEVPGVTVVDVYGSYDGATWFKVYGLQYIYTGAGNSAEKLGGPLPLYIKFSPSSGSLTSSFAELWRSI